MNKPNLFFMIFTLTTIIIFCHCSRQTANKHYPVNRPPLVQTKFVKLPLGSVRPAGWLRDQLLAQSQGLTGHLDEFWPDLIHSAWKGGDGESWERGPYYLDGLVPLAYLLDDQRLIEKTKPWIEWILNSGQSDGWFGPETNKDRWPLAVAMKVIAQYHEATQDPRAMNLLTNYFSYLNNQAPDWPDDAWRGVRAMENAVTGYWLFRKSGDPDILPAIASIQSNSFDWVNYFVEFPWDTQAMNEDRIPHNWKADGLTAHVVNVAMAVKYPGIWYQQSGDDQFKKAVYTGIENLDKHHGQVGGRFSGDEHLSGKRPTQGTELCAVVEFMFSLEKLMEIFGDPELGDRLELLAYNSLPGTMTPDCWAHQYDQQSNQVMVTRAKREWSTNGDASNIYGLMPNYPCCLANMHQGWPKFVEHMWMATHDQGLVVIAYGPCEVTAKAGNNGEIHLIEETEYPFDGTIKFKLQLTKPASFPLYFRIPQWAEGAELKIRDDTIATTPGTFAMAKRKWKSGDEIRLMLPMNLRTERRYNNSISIMRGPLYYALRINKKYKKITLKERNFGSIAYMGSVDWEIKNASPWNYALVLNMEDIDHSVTAQRNKISRFPFSDINEPVYLSEDQGIVQWKSEAPVVLKVQGKRLPNWKLENHSAADPPAGPVESNEREETLKLVPYGCTRLRVTEFPIL